MNDDDNHIEPQPWIDPALEARVVAAVMGESSAFEAAELERMVAENPELAIFQRRIAAVHALVGVAARPDEPRLRLSPERRKKVLETIGAGAGVPVEKVRVLAPERRNGWSARRLIAVAACIALVVFVLATLSVPSATRTLAHVGAVSSSAAVIAEATG